MKRVPFECGTRAVRCAPLLRSNAAKAFDFLLGPGDRLIDRLPALGAVRDQLCHRRPARTSGWRSWAAPGLPRSTASRIAARRVIEQGSLRRTLLVPDREVAEFLVDRHVIAAARVDQRLDRRALATGTSSRLFAAGLFCANFQIPQNQGMPASIRPFGPLGGGKVQSCSAIFGASRTATAQAEGGLRISEPLPEIRYLLLLALSQAKTSGGSDGDEPLEPFEHGLDRLGIDGDVAVLVHQLSAIAGKHRADPVHRIRRDPERQTERIAGREAFLRRRQKILPVSSRRQAPCPAGPGRVHLR